MLEIQAPDGRLETIRATAEHPFYVEGTGFVPAGRLTIGTGIVSLANDDRQPYLQVASRDNDSSGALLVKSLTLEAGEQTVYNFRVADTHSYAAGTLKAWVHNADYPVPTGPTRVVNSNMAHAAEKSVERAGFPNVKAAREALQEFGDRIKNDGLPNTAVRDTARSDRVIVPGFGEGGAVVYQIAEEGKLTLKTVLIWIPQP